MKYALDKNGSLKDRNQWDHDFAEKSAGEENITLTQDHWDVIFFFQEFYSNHQLTPSMRVLIKYLKTRWNEEKATSTYLHSLFRKSIMLQASRIAGLPKPSRCL